MILMPTCQNTPSTHGLIVTLLTNKAEHCLSFCLYWWSYITANWSLPTQMSRDQCKREIPESFNKIWWRMNLFKASMTDNIWAMQDSLTHLKLPSLDQLFLDFSVNTPRVVYQSFFFFWMMQKEIFHKASNYIPSCAHILSKCYQ